MGWSGGTYIFDAVLDHVLADKEIDKKELITDLISVLADRDWDTEGESEYWDHPLVQEIFREKYPNWFEDEP